MQHVLEKKLFAGHPRGFFDLRTQNFGALGLPKWFGERRRLREKMR